MTTLADARRRSGVLRGAGALALALSLPGMSAAGQIAVSSEIQGALYPREPSGRPAIDHEVRGWAAIEYDRPLRANVDFTADVIVYGSDARRGFVDAEVKVAWRGERTALAAGLLRERWGRFTDSPIDPLGPGNTPFSLVHPEQRLSQPTIRGTAFFEGLSVDVYGLIGHRRQPLPDAEGRFGFGVTTAGDVRRGGMGDHALAVRVSGAQPALDWAAHVFRGLSRRPTFVPRFTADARLAAIDAVYVELLQVGGEAETTHAGWRYLTEGFARRGALDVTGRERAYGYVAAAAEYQRFGAFDGAYNIIPRLEFMADTRGDRADIPFASAVRAGMRIATTQLRPLQAEVAYSYDWAFRGHGVVGGIEKTLAESPTVNLGFRFTAFSSGVKPSVLDIWKDDHELLGYVRFELSR